MPCQLMVGFFAYAKSREINVDKDELEGRFDIQNMVGILIFVWPYDLPEEYLASCVS